MHDLRTKLGGWQEDYNHRRPHGSLGHLTPSEYVKKWSGEPNQATRPYFRTVRIPGERQDSCFHKHHGVRESIG